MVFFALNVSGGSTIDAKGARGEGSVQYYGLRYAFLAYSCWSLQGPVGGSRECSLLVVMKKVLHPV